MDISIEELFENSFVLTIDDNRLSRFYNFLRAEGIDVLPKKFMGFTNGNLGGVENCTLGHISMIKMAKALDLPFIFIFEDDAYPIDNLKQKLDIYLKGIPDDAYVLKLGWWYNYKLSNLNNKFNLSNDNTWGTHAYIIFKNAYDFYLNEYNKDLKLAADWFFKKMSDANKKVAVSKELLFIQYTDVKSMNGYVGYIYNGKTAETPPDGYSTIDKKNVPKLKEIELDCSNDDELFKDISFEEGFLYRANGGNLGDFAIAASEYQLFSNLKLKYETISSANKSQLTNTPFNLVYGGGGGWVKYYNYDDPINTLFKSQNLKKCVIMPSTFYECDNLITNLFDERFIVYCRDRKSFDYCRSKNSKAAFKLHDDIAFKLDISKFDYSKLPYDSKDAEIVNLCKRIDEFLSNHKGDLAEFFRRDVEKTNKTTEGDLDLSSLLCRYGEKFDIQSTFEATQVLLYTLNKFNTIRTNRLHIAILSCLLGKKIGLWDNSYGKIKAIYEMSIKDKFKEVYTHFD